MNPYTPVEAPTWTIAAAAEGAALAEAVERRMFANMPSSFRPIAAMRSDIKVVALGTGQALDMARRGDADVLFVHDQVAEEKFVADGWGVKRYPVMYNDFILIGPKNDPAGTQGKDIVQALQKLAATNGTFISRGDKSGKRSSLGAGGRG